MKLSIAETVMSGDAEARASLPTGCPVSQSFDPFGAAFVQDPARAMRAEPPVFYSEKLGWYVVTRMEEARAVLSDPEGFSSQKFAEPITPLCPAAADKLKSYDFIPLKTLAT